MSEPEDCLFFSNIGGVRLGPFRTVEEAEEARVKEEQRQNKKPRLKSCLDNVLRQREPGDDDDVPAPPRFDLHGNLLPYPSGMTPPDQNVALLEHAVKKVLAEMGARCDATFCGYRCSNEKGHKGNHQCPPGTYGDVKLLELQRKWEAEDAK
jgi:hypothetical protein